MSTDTTIVIDLAYNALQHIRQTYIDTFGPLPEEYTANDIDYDICELIKAAKPK